MKNIINGGFKDVKPRFQFSSPIDGIVSLLTISNGTSSSTTIVRLQQFKSSHFFFDSLALWKKKRALNI